MEHEASDGRFVVQHHLATADHYDLRLEIDAVLVSWAIPKGPSTDPRMRRMAIRTGDHDLAHESVEGAFGRSTVQVWDRGTYENTSRHADVPIDPGTALTNGHLSFRVHGEKLHGGYALIRLPDAQRETWLLIKKADADADPYRDITGEQTRSVLSGRTIEEIAGQDEAQPWP